MKNRYTIVTKIIHACIIMTAVFFLSQNPAYALENVVSSSAGLKHSLALTGDGTVWAWGDNTYGQLGDGTNIQRDTPVQVNGTTNVKQVAAGRNHSIILKNDGTVWTWGNNPSGQLGNGTYNNMTNTPIQVADLTDVVDIASGSLHGLALKKDGTLWTWGLVGTRYLTPVKVEGITDIKEFAGGEQYSIVVKNDGTVWVWGQNFNGQLGLNKGLEPVQTPTKIDTLTNIVSVGTGYTTGYALDAQGRVFAWGHNAFGQAGDGTIDNFKFSPVQVLNLTDIVEISSGSTAKHCLARKKDGTIYAWGRNDFGQFGNGTIVNSNIPIKITLP